ncbi:unnamed protein product [Heligmosomoides polygyrus]|uniref:RCC1/BLIP-II n=1 Tax=Heligmosomoides polygyrus TaxID=6339 RepID=A0A3P8C5A2_HELPZ|nr:unnamed protein product [Heligmosomoides polygyrus]
MLVSSTSFLIQFPRRCLIVDVTVDGYIKDTCATHNFIAVVTDKHIYIAHKDQMEATKASSDVILTSTLSSIFLVCTKGEDSVVIRLFNEWDYFKSRVIKPIIVQNQDSVRIVAAVSGNDHSIFLTNKGAVYSLGTGSRGELGVGLMPRVTELTIVEALEGLKVVQIAAAGWHSGALTADGDVYLWGWNHRGQLGDGKEKVEYYPSPLDIDIRIVRMEMRDHLTALWTAEGMPALRLRYHDHSLDKESQLAWRMRTAGTKADDSDDCLVADRNVETVLVTGDEEASPNPLEKLLARGCS